MAAFRSSRAVMCFFLLFMLAYAPTTYAQAKPASPPKAAGPIGRNQARAMRTALAGKWIATDMGRAELQLQLRPDGRFVLNRDHGQYTVQGNTLKLETKAGETGYTFDLKGDVLTLSGGDLAQAIKLTRKSEVRSYWRRLYRFSPQSAKRKLQRIAVVLAIVIVSHLLILLLRVLSRFAVYSEWGPLHFAYRRHKSRVMTIHSLILNALKTVIYFVALGLVLSELGINYKVYVASLSVIGLAVGFGSQGLLRDLVTGIFIIFDGQFEVGDMVEIARQTGIVEDLGLRVTRLRNHLGQTLIIPNRNITMVGNYRRGALQAFVDVAMPDPQTAEKATPILNKLGAEIGKQFDGVVLAAPHVTRVLSLDTGEHFARLHAAIWPAQQWVVDQQLLPRIREALTAEAIEVPNDRVVAFYQMPEKATSP